MAEHLKTLFSDRNDKEPPPPPEVTHNQDVFDIPWDENPTK